jgi:carboxyl-terminal processing protease
MVIAQAWRPSACLGLAVLWLSVMVGGCVQPSTMTPAKAALLQQLRESYLFEVDLTGLEPLSVPEIVARLDPDTRLVERRRQISLDFIRGFEPEGSLTAMRDLGGGRAYLRLGFFGRRTFEDVQKAISHFTPQLCTLIIDLRDNAGGSFEQGLRLAELFLPSGVPLAIYEDRQERALLYATGTTAPRQEQLVLWLNARTASSAELFAGILRWHHRAELVGLPTAGKRTVQQVVRLDQAHLLFLTTGRFLAPNGVPFGAHGLTPDRPYNGDQAESLAAACIAPSP